MAGNLSKLRRLSTKLWKQLLILIMAVLIVFVLTPLQLVLVIPFFIIRQSVKLTARIFRPDLQEIFSGMGVFVALESVYTRPKNVILINLICDERLDVVKLRLEFQRRVLNFCDKKGNLPYAHFRQCWTQFLGFFFWRWDTSFSLQNHIRLYDYNEPELALPKVCTEEDLKRVSGPLITRPFKEGRSPWEMLIISNYRSSDDCAEVESSQTVAVLRVHHALADGYSILKVLLKLIGPEGDRATVPQPNFPKMSAWKQCLGAIVQSLRLPFDMASRICSAFDGPNSWHLVDQKLSSKCLTFYSDSIPVGTIKDIKNKHGVSYNVAVYAIALGGIRRMMLEAGQEVPKRISCFVPLPLPHHPGGLVIHATGIIFPFYPRVHGATERLQQVFEGFRILQTSPMLLKVPPKLVNLWSKLPVWMLRPIYNKAMVTVGMASFPGTEQQLNVLGTAKLVDIISALGHPAGKTGAVASLVSLAGRQRIGLTVDQEIFKSYKVPDNFAKYINDEVYALLHADGEPKIEEV